MTNSKHVPKRRFKEFESDGEWGQEYLGKIVDFSIKTNSLSREKLSLESYEVQNIHYGDVLIKFDNVLDLQRDSLPSIINSKILDFKESLLQDGDLIFADAAEDSTVGKAIEIRNIGGKNVVSGLHTIAARPTQLFAPFYLGYYINSNFYHDQILPLMQGTKVSSISKSNLQVTKITFPTIDEQKELGKFFQTIDSLITLHQHKLDKLKNLKKSYLAELFPAEGKRVPKRRFPGFEGEWEEKKLGDVGKTFTGLSGKTKVDFGHGNGMYVTYLNIYSNEIADLRGLDKIEIDDRQTEVKYGDVFFTTSSETPEEVGLSSVWKYDLSNVYLNSFCFGFRPNVKFDIDFLAYLLRSPAFRAGMKLLAQGISRYNISKNRVLELNILFPTLKEQEKIGKQLSLLDKSITLQQQKLDKLKDLKKAYLNELFV